MPAKALEEFDEAFRLWPNNPWARYYAARRGRGAGRLRSRHRGVSLLDPDQPGRDRCAHARRGAAAGARQPERRPHGAPDRDAGHAAGDRGPAAGHAARRVSPTTRRDGHQYLALIEAAHPNWAGMALSEAADGVAGRSGPALALGHADHGAGRRLRRSALRRGLRALVKYSHAGGSVRRDAGRAPKVLAAHPDSSAFQEIRGFDLELSGAPARSGFRGLCARARARPRQLAGADGPRPTGGGSQRPPGGARLLRSRRGGGPHRPGAEAGGRQGPGRARKVAEAEQRLDALLAEHPFDVEAAAERARLDLEQGVATPQTVERARRAVRFGGGPDALDLLSRVHAQRKEPELAAQAAEEAKAMREAKPARASPGRRGQGLSRVVPTGGSGNSFPPTRKTISLARPDGRRRTAPSRLNHLI